MTRIFEEIKKEIGFSFPENTIFEHSDVLKLVKDKNSFTIYYSEKRELMQAALIAKANADLQEYCVEERRRFDDMCFFIDCSRNGVLTVETMKKLMRNVAMLGYNALMIYTEDTYEVNNEPVFGFLRGRYSKAEMKEMDAYGRELGIEVIPAIQTLAHLDHLRRGYKEYQQCFDDIKNTLMVGDERVYQLIDNMFATLQECYTTRRVHIGLDEAHDMGRGQYLDKHGYRNPFEIFTEHLTRIASIAEKYGFTLLMWSDMFWKIAYKEKSYFDEDGKVAIPPEVLAKIPSNVSVCHWSYGATYSQDYEDIFKIHNGFQSDVWFCGSSYKCNGFTPHNRFSEKEFNLAFSMVEKYGIKRLINCGWADYGAEASNFSILPAIAYYAAKAFKLTKKEMKKRFLALTGYEYDVFCKLDYPNTFCGTCENDCSQISKNYLYNDLFFAHFDGYVNLEWKKYYPKARNILRRSAKGQYDYIFEMEAALCDVLINKYDMGLRIRNAYHKGDKKALANLALEIKVVLKKLRIFLKKFRYRWFKENKPNGFDVQDLRLGGLIERISFCYQRINAYLRGEISEIVELHEEILTDIYDTFKESTGRLVGHMEPEIVMTVHGF